MNTRHDRRLLILGGVGTAVWLGVPSALLVRGLTGDWWQGWETLHQFAVVCVIGFVWYWGGYSIGRDTERRSIARRLGAALAHGEAVMERRPPEMKDRHRREMLELAERHMRERERLEQES